MGLDTPTAKKTSESVSKGLVTVENSLCAWQFSVNEHP